MAGRYKPIGLDAVKHDPPDEILAHIVRIEKEIAERAEKLRQTINTK